MDAYTGGNRPSTFGAPYPMLGPATRTPNAEPDEPTAEEIARAMNAEFVPCSALTGYRIAKALKRAELVQEGRAISQNTAHSEATLMALANITRIGAPARVKKIMGLVAKSTAAA